MVVEPIGPQLNPVLPSGTEPASSGPFKVAEPIGPGSDTVPENYRNRTVPAPPDNR